MALLVDGLGTRPIEPRTADARLVDPRPAPVGDRYDLCRFVRAQAGIYQRALAELQAGAKTTHWMWYIFPQIQGLGLSSNARLFALAGLKEAQAYAAHDLLGPRIVECAEAMLEWAGKRKAAEILGVIDAMKFHSSMTLFEAANRAEPCFAETLEAFYGGQRDRATLERLAAH